ncbi:MAG: hypothetical protein OEW39_11590 [Deltaproteobacteria bacterium]|nr:hypothetical protein [Deltaproteobacteria bacterium]
MKLLFISSSRFGRRSFLDHSVRYRCYHIAEALSNEGHRVEICTLEALVALEPSQLRGYDALIFHKPRYSARLKRLIASRIRAKQLVVADYDDLIFGDPESAPPYLYGRTSPRAIRGIYHLNTLALHLFRHFTTSTQPLAEELAAIHPTAQIAVVSNGLSPYWLERNQGLLPLRNKDRAPQIITYLPGTPSHDLDFNMIEEPLAAFLWAHPAIQFRVGGQLKFQPGKFPPAQLVQEAYRPYLQLPELIITSSITLAPLQTNRFTRCKSRVKFMESAAFGIPVVASPNPDLSTHACPGLFLPRTPGDWVEALEHALEADQDPKTGEELRAYAKEHLQAETSARRLLEVLAAWRDHGRVA